MDVEHAERRLLAATSLAAVEAVGLCLLVFARNGTRTSLLALSLLAKLPFCWLALRHHAGGYLALLLWEGAGVVVALLAPDVDVFVRLAVVLVAATVFGLLVSTSPLFPAPDLPEPDR